MVLAPVRGQLMPRLEKELKKKEPALEGIEKEIPKEKEKKK
jgi:hypothetical protein